MSDYDDLYRQKSSVEYQMQCAQNDISNLQEQIDRLYAAKNAIEHEKEECFSTVGSISAFSLKWYDWQGEQYTSFSENADNYVKKSMEYYQYIDDVADEINRTITRLEIQQSDSRGLWGWCVSRWRELCTLIENATN